MKILKELIFLLKQEKKNRSLQFLFKRFPLYIFEDMNVNSI